MGSSDDHIFYAGLIGAALLAYWLILNKGTDQAADAGKWVAQNIINPAKNPGNNPFAYGLAALKGTLAGRGSETLYVPPTPIGYNDSNWTWQLKDKRTFLGLPAGMTPEEFCAGSPGSPICVEIRAGRA